MDNPILIDLPYSFETDRLTLRGPLPGDGSRLRDAIIESQAELKPWMPWAIDIQSEVEQEVWARERQLKFLAREDLLFILLLKGTDTIVGASGLHRIDWTVPKFEIGYWVRTSFAGQGYISEAVLGLTSLAFDTLGAQRVEIRCDVNNVRSAAVAQRIGYTLEGIFRNDARDHFGELRDTNIFARVREGG